MSKITHEALPACPVCSGPARQHTRSEDRTDGPGCTYWAYMECTSCGLRSREVVGWEGARAKLTAEWTPTTQPVLRTCDHCGVERDERLPPVKMSSPRDDGGCDEWTVHLCDNCMEGVTDALPMG